MEDILGLKNSEKKEKENQIGSEETERKYKPKIIKKFAWDAGYNSNKYAMYDWDKKEFMLNELASIAQITWSDFEFSMNDAPDFYKGETNIKFNGDTYDLGNYAIEESDDGGDRNFMDNKYDSNKEKAMLGAGVSLFTKRDNIVIEELLVGLPIEQYKKDRENIEEFYTGVEIEYEIPNGQEYEKKILKVKDCHCYPQGIASYYDTVINDKLKIVNGSKGGRLAILDFGGKTFDAVIARLKDNKPVKNTDLFLEKGVIDIFKIVAEKEFKNAPDILIENLFLEKVETETWKGKQITSEEVIEKCRPYFKTFVNELYQKIHSKWSSRFNRLSEVLFTGGGGYILDEFLTDKFENYGEDGIKTRLNENPRYANVKAYLKMKAIQDRVKQ